MLLARRNNNVSNWLNNWFNDNFFDTELMPHMNATAPAVNVKEDATAYTMEIAAPGLKKDMVKMNIDKDGYLNVSIENKDEKKEEKKEEHYLRREFSYPLSTSRHTLVYCGFSTARIASKDGYAHTLSSCPYPMIMLRSKP